MLWNCGFKVAKWRKSRTAFPAWFQFWQGSKNCFPGHGMTLHRLRWFPGWFECLWWLSQPDKGRLHAASVLIDLPDVKIIYFQFFVLTTIYSHISHYFGHEGVVSVCFLSTQRRGCSYGLTEVRRELIVLARGKVTSQHQVFGHLTNKSIKYSKHLISS